MYDALHSFYSGYLLLSFYSEFIRTRPGAMQNLRKSLKSVNLSLSKGRERKGEKDRERTIFYTHIKSCISKRIINLKFALIFFSLIHYLFKQKNYLLDKFSI